MEFLENSQIYLDYLCSDRIPFPRALQVELTSYCNLKCVMCPKTLKAFRSEPDKSMEPDILDYITTSILPYVHRIDVVGDGEPLIALDLLINLLESASVFKVPVTICSNGVLLDTTLAQRLIDLNLKDLNISIDAATPATYRKIRGADFEQLLYNLRSLQELKRQSGATTPHLHFSMVAMRDNIEELPHLIELAQTLGVESVTVQAMGEDSAEIAGQSAFLHHRDLAEEVIYKCLIESEAMGYPLKLWPAQITEVMSTNDDLKEFLSGEMPPPGDPAEWRKNCSFLWHAPFITTNGDVRPCCSRLPSMGNLKEESFHDIWYGQKYSDLRRKMLKGDYIEQCWRCPGMGWRKVLVPKNHVDASDEIFNYYPGWHEPELEERSFRWARERAAVYLKSSDSDKFLLMQLRKSSLSGAPSSGQITINNEKPIPFQINTTNWETLEFPLPDVNADQFFRVEFNFPNAIRPADVEKSSSDPRDISMKLARTWTESWAKKVVFGRMIILLGYEVTPESWVLGGEVVIRTFWRTLDQVSQNLKVFMHFSREGNTGIGTTAVGRKLGFGKKDFFQADHLLLCSGAPSSMWQQGAFIADEHYFLIPDDIHSGHYRFELGLYPEGATKDRIPITRSDREFDKDRALLGTVLISDK